MSYQITIDSKSIPKSVNTLGAGVYLLDFGEEGSYVGFSSNIGKRVRQHVKGFLAWKHPNDLLQMAWIRQHSFTVSLLEATGVGMYSFEMTEPYWMMSLDPKLNRPRDLQGSISRGLSNSIISVSEKDITKFDLAKRFLLKASKRQYRFKALHRNYRIRIHDYLAQKDADKDVRKALMSLGLISVKTI